MGLHNRTMLVIEERKNGFTALQKSRIHSSVASQEGDEIMVAISKKMISAFTESERDNEEMIHRIKQNGINQIMDAISKAEKHNDAKIHEMLNLLPHHEQETVGAYNPNIPSDLLLELR